MAEQQLHVVMLPFSAFGHMIPFLQLSIALAKHGVRVTYVSTPNNIKRLPKVPSNLASLITLVALPMPELQHGDLSKGAEATLDIPSEKIPLLNVAYDLLQYPFQKLVVEQSPDWIIIDFMPYWVIEIGKQHKIPVMYFSVYSAAVGSFLGPPEYIIGEGRERVRPSMESLMSPPNWVDFPSSVAFKKHEAIPFFAILYGQFSAGHGANVSLAERIAKILKGTQAICYRTCNEFEGQYVNLLRKLHKKPIIPTGLLPLDKPEEGNQFNDHHEGSWNQIFKWLDEQKPKSTVFVGFGSECKLTKVQVHEIAYGLEFSELPFLWAMRKPKWANNDEIEVLPHGFEERTKGKGVVKLGWAPQKEILRHSSIGGSLFHSGWGSVIETLQFGHCLVALPMVNDQGLVARLLVEKGLAMEIERSEDGTFNRDDIAKALKIAMVSNEGETLRARAREAATVFGDMKLQQEHYVGELVNFLKSHKV